MPDLTNLPLASIIGLLVIFAAIDTIGTQLIAVSSGNWSGDYALNFLVSHVAKTWFPIIAMAVLGNGVAAIPIPPVPLAGAAAIGSLAVYGLATVASLKGSLDDRAVVPLTKG